MTGRIHSIESFGTVDGPGIRLVVFFQGCPLRCQYCHNPDSWKISEGHEISTDEILEQYEKNKAFYKKGGITATGGEPMMQMDFLTELFSKAREKGIHTCLDTSGIVFRFEKIAEVDRLLDVTDLVMLDIKEIRAEDHRTLTGHDNGPVLDFLKYLNKRQIPLWIRHVLVPGITNDRTKLRKLGQLLAPYDSIKVLDVLPYHTMGKAKYEKLHLPYPLGNTPEATEDEALAARKIIIDEMKKSRTVLPENLV